MIVHRILDAVFRTLDTVDAIRARVDTALGRADAQPPSSWPAVIEDDARVDAQDVRATYAPVDVDAYKQRDEAAAAVTSTSQDATPSSAPTSGGTSGAAPDAAPDAPAGAPAGATPKKAAKKGESTLPTPAKKATKKGDSTLPTPAKKSSSTTSSSSTKTAAKKKAGNRKGSVDRQGRDLDSPRANDVAAWIEANEAAVVAEDAALDGKRTLARVVWAVAMAEQAGVVEGLTAADTSALLSSAADVEVFATNVARAFRDEHALFSETSPDGRSKRYVLTDAGRGRLGEVATR
ncbi:MAG TPA: hypothetical protein VGF99_16645 [Myxococcota bacterium]